MKGHRLNLYLPARSMEQLLNLKKQSGKTLAAIIRELIERASEKNMDRWIEEVSDRLGIRPPKEYK